MSRILFDSFDAAPSAPTPHVFNTNIFQPQRTIIQQGAVALLSALKRPTGYLADVVPYGGVVRSYTDGIDIEALMKTFNRTPSIGVATATRDFQVLAIGGRQAISECELLLYFATQHSRDMQKGRMESDSVGLANANADPGLHVIMEHALELILGQYPTTLTGTIKQIKPVREEELATLPEITIWLQTYRITLQSYGGGSKEWRTPAQLLQSIGWRVTTNPDEPNRPAAATVSTSLDEDSDLT